MNDTESEDRFQTEGERLSEQFRNLRANRQVLDWWQKQLTEIRYGYEGVSHIVNKAIASSVSNRQELLGKIQELTDRCEKMEADRAESMAVIGELQIRMEKMADWAKKQQQPKREN